MCSNMSGLVVSAWLKLIRLCNDVNNQQDATIFSFINLFNSD